MSRGLLGWFHWRGIKRWCLFGAIAMLLWLLYPVARCSFSVFRDTPIGEVHDEQVGQSDRKRVIEGEGFIGGWWDKTQICYDRTPITGQEPWKSDLLFGFGIAAVVAWALERFTTHRLRGSD